MEKRIYFLVSIFLMSISVLQAQTVAITIDAAAGQHKISPFIYGRNNFLSSDPDKPLSAADWQLLRDAGVKILRENGGNNSTKYNWRKKISSHPDWYNNVYDNNWDFEVTSMQENMPSLSGIWALQLIGKAASNKNHNFNDWEYNRSQWWSGVNQNLAGGGQPNTSGGSKALTEGNPDLYTMIWPADSTVGILSHWLNNLHIDKNRILYWNMDNEPEIWNGTHDDIMPVQISAEDFVQRYITVAKKARAVFPEIKLLGPVPANEWQWYAYNNQKISYQGKSYVWLEYFIKRIADEQKSSGIRLLDVVDIHFYPDESGADDIMQGHRVYFDKNYDYPGANGVKISGSSGWDGSITKEYVFERCKAWLDQHMGSNHGVGLGVTETGIKVVNPMVTAVWYASVLGEFAKQNVEIFTPWSWETGMWETLHLFSRYSKETSVQAVSSNETYVSAYPSLSLNNDSLTVILVNRYQDRSQSVKLNLSNFTVENGSYHTLTLESLPGNETFRSHTDNALKKNSVTTTNNSLTVTLPRLSVTAVLLKGKTNSLSESNGFLNNVQLYPVPSGQSVTLDFSMPMSEEIRIELFDVRGKLIRTIIKEKRTSGSYRETINTDDLQPGTYIVKLTTGQNVIQKKMVVN